MNAELQKEADLCVKCGLCLPYCPTYRKTANENESPRGRIALIQGWASENLAATDRLQTHIDRCLLCRTCERVCPAEVPYGRLVDQFRRETRSQRPVQIKTALMKRVAGRKKLADRLPSLIKYYRNTGLQSLLRRIGLLRLLQWDSIDRLLPAPEGQGLELQDFYPALGESKGTVGLFVGCLGKLLDGDTVEAAVRCLTAAGFDVCVPASQGCCGAMHRHDGDFETASALAENNVRAFVDRNLLAIVSIASGCGSQLQEYVEQEFAGRVVDVSSFLIRNGCDFSGRLKPLPETVCLHSPCSLRNVMNQEQGVRQLLRQIPGIRLVELDSEIHCCGSAGTYMLEHSAMAESLADDILDSLSHSGARILATSNIGCALHLAASVRRRNLPIEVLHPVALLMRQWHSQ